LTVHFFGLPIDGTKHLFDALLSTSNLIALAGDVAFLCPSLFNSWEHCDSIVVKPRKNNTNFFIQAPFIF
jgi:hypothetical protein